jgi:group I intron endonuclease
MHHFVYETTNLINNKKYIGKHSTTNIDDGYLGSGKILLQAISKYGRKNFKRKILFKAKNESQAYAYEEKLITVGIVNNTMYYNLIIGGEGCNSGENHPMYGKEHTKETKKKMSIIRKGKKGKKHTKETKKKMSIASKGKNNGMWKIGENHPMYGKHHTEEIKKRISNSKKGKSKGEDNPNVKLTERNVIDIKKKLQQGDKSLIIANIYEVSKSTIDNIKYNRTWKHITI